VTVTKERMLPLYQGMMLGAYDHRAADVVKSPTAQKRQNQPQYLTDEEKADPQREALPASWIRADLVDEDMPAWLIGFSSLTSATNTWTMVESPRVVRRVSIVAP
jgi:hypothetical protein